MSTHHHGGGDTVVAPAGAQRVALVGNPNAGKSTLFNALTGLSAKVANYPGVTVSRSVGTVAVGDEHIVVEDLPGTYSFDPISPDEQIVAKVVEGYEGQPPDGIVVVLDATSLRRSLGLLAQAQQLGVPLLVVLTFADELTRRGGGIDVAALSEAVGNQVVAVTAGNRNQLHDLIDQLPDAHCWRTPAVPAPTDPAQVTGWIESVLTASNYHLPQVDARTRRIDAVLLHPVWGTLVFLVTMVVFFQVIFTVATPIKDLLATFFGWLSTLVTNYVTIDWLSGLLSNGIIGGVGTVLSFLPQIVLLFAMIAIFESTGYMSRVAFLMDRVMGRAGLEGRAFVAMLSSVACAVPGIMATRSLPSARDRIATMMTAPLMTCSARLPVYTMLIGMLVPANISFGPLGLQGLVMFGMYLLGAVAAMVAAWVFKHVVRGKGAALPFYMEMPSYQAPRLSDIGHAIWEAGEHFIRRVGRIIFVLTIAIWALLNLPVASARSIEAAGIDPNDTAAVATYQIDHSAAAAVGKTIQPVFEPLGFDWRITVGLLSAMGARETFVATMGQVAAADNPDDPSAALDQLTWISGPHAGQKLFTAEVTAALLVYFAFALQCTSTIAILKQESGGWKWPIIAFVYLTALAWVSALIVKLIVGAAVG